MGTFKVPILRHREVTFATSRRSNCYIGTSQKWKVFVEEENNPQKDE